MQKIKSINLNGLFKIVKCSLIGIVSTLIGIVIFAVVLKFSNLPLTFIKWVNDLIKIFSIFIMVMCIKRANGDRLMFKALFAGLIYSLLTYVIFSILNGDFVLGLSFLYDILFALIVSAIVSVIINILNQKKV